MLKITQKEAKPTVAPTVGRDADRTILPLELTNVPGIVALQTAYTESISRYPNRRTAFVGALAMLSLASGRRYRAEDNTRTNEYFVCYANSGAGKDAPRKVNKEIAISCGAAKNIADTIGSGEGLQDALLAKAKFLLQSDEFDTLIRAIAEDKSGSKESLVREMLTEYSSAGGMISKRSLSVANKPSATSNDYCIYPHFALYASAIGQYVFEALTERVLQNGLVARCLMVDCGRRQKRQPATWSPVPEALLTAYKEIFGTLETGGKLALPDDPLKKTEPFIIRYTASARELSERLLDEYDRAYDALNEGEHAAEQSFLARSGEHLTKLAMLYAISEQHENPTITVEALEWASGFVTHCQRATLQSVERYTAANPHEANVKRILRAMERRSQMTRREITKNLRLPVSQVDEVVEYMVAAGLILALDGEEDVFRRMPQ